MLRESEEYLKGENQIKKLIYFKFFYVNDSDVLIFLLLNKTNKRMNLFILQQLQQLENQAQAQKKVKRKLRRKANLTASL